MINVNDIKNGMTVKIDNNIYTVVDFQHVKPGKGSAFVRTKLKNLRTGATTEITYILFYEYANLWPNRAFKIFTWWWC